MVDTSLIPSPEWKEEVLHAKGHTFDIVDVIVQTDKQQACTPEWKRFAEQFRGDLPKLWKFVNRDIKYRIDGFERQDIKTPAALWATRVGDCKSKTLFVNQVLKCLGIAYKIRFTSYNGGELPTHVYTVAKVQGKEVILDTVYTAYNKEKAYHKKWDYDMTRISRISGLGGDDVSKKLEELHHKQSYVPNEEFIDFSSLTDGEAALLIAKRQLEILGAMRPEQKQIYKKGIELIKSSLHGNGKGLYSNSKIAGVGVLPNELMPLAAMIERRMNEPQSQIPAMGFGLQAIQGIGIGNAAACAPGTPTRFATSEIFVNGKYFYGANSPYERTAAFMEPIYTALANTYMANGWAATTALPGQQGNLFALTFNSDTCKRAFLNELKSRSGIMTQYVNDLFAQTRSGRGGELVTTRRGTVGTGCVYNFAGTTVVGGRPLSLNDFPNAVSIKSAMQSQYLSSVSFFSGLSMANINNLSRNGALFDTGEQPEQFLAGMMAQNRAGVGAIDPVSLTLIITAVVSLVSAIAAEISRKTQEARQIDTSQADQARITPLPEVNMFAENDWRTAGAGTGTGGASGGGTGASGGAGTGGSAGGAGGGNTGLLLAAAAGGLYFLTRK